MRNRLFGWLMSRQKGFTLIELMVAATIMGTVVTALTDITVSIFHSTDDNNGRVEAVTGIEIVAHEMTVDGMSAQKYTPLDNDGNPADTGNSVRLTWIEPIPDTPKYEITYKLQGTDLQRVQKITYRGPDGVFGGDDDIVPPPTEQTLAREVTRLQFDKAPSPYDDYAFIVTIASTGGGTRITEIREYSVMLRPDPNLPLPE